MPAAAPARTGFADSLRTRRRTLISLTPLIDVVFILLIFFMLASSFADWRAINLTQPAATGGGEPMAGAILVDVRPEGVRMSGLRMTLEELRARAAGHVAGAPDRLFIVRPVQGVDLQTAIHVMDALSLSGVQRISLEGAGAQ